jgi:hypothetical protein
MRKIFLLSCVVLLSGGVVMAQSRKERKKNKEKSETTQAPLVIESAANATPATTGEVPATPATTLKVDDLEFTEVVHDFGTVIEGPDAKCVFTFVNKGTEPIIIQKAQPSCGCTVPSFSSDPVAPGATGKIDVAYHTQGKPNAFSKSITVVSNAGTKMLTIKGTVEKAPTSSVPENTSMMKTN